MMKYQYKPTPAVCDFQPILRPRSCAAARKMEEKLLREQRNALYIADGMELNGELELTRVEANKLIPKNYSEASNDSNWMTAIEEEARSFLQHAVFTVEHKEPWMKCPPGKWIFTRKQLADRGIRHKARFLAIGYRQRAGLDYGTYLCTDYCKYHIKRILQHHC